MGNFNLANQLVKEALKTLSSQSRKPNPIELFSLKRNEYFKKKIQDGFSLENFKKMFIKYEDFKQIENNEEYDFAYAEEFKEFIHQPDYKNGFVLDCVMCGKSPENYLNNLLFII